MSRPMVYVLTFNGESGGIAGVFDSPAAATAYADKLDGGIPRGDWYGVKMWRNDGPNRTDGLDAIGDVRWTIVGYGVRS